MNTTYYNLATAVHNVLSLGKVSIKLNSHSAYEVWLRHTQDNQEEFLYAQGWDTIDFDQTLYWAFAQAEDVLNSDAEAPEKAIARKFIFNIWKARNEHIDKVLHKCDSSWQEYKFIDNDIAKTLPDGHEEQWQVWNTLHTRHIKGGKWHKGPYTK